SYTVSGSICSQTITLTVTSGVIPAPTSNAFAVCPAKLNTVVTNPITGTGSTHLWYLVPKGYTGTNPPKAPGLNTANPYTYPTPNLTHQGDVFVDTVRSNLGCITGIYRDTVLHVSLIDSLAFIEQNQCYHDSSAQIKIILKGGVDPKNHFVTVTPNYSMTWVPLSPNTTLPIKGDSAKIYTTLPASSNIVNLHDGSYQLTINTTDGCSRIDTFKITGPGKPNDTLTVQAIFCHGDTIGTLIGPPGLTNYQWYSVSYPGGIKRETILHGVTSDTIGILNPEATYSSYALTFFINGCKRHELVTVPITPPPPFSPEITVNIFTPNGDKINDKFMPFYHPLMSQKSIAYYADQFNLKIFDRWGRFIYETSDYNQGWDGKSNGKEVDDGNYFWIASYKPRCGNNADVVIKQGFVQVLH
ncbi:MAG TPA: gliding motility-associated C-terminal domain-containing protein, partial [Nitrosopumilaceae archaeon]|nr:gliding motility-associated C-terminal domain-containing protein [Nitrosopumilaceae archaeon]